MNNANERATTGATLVRVDAERQRLEARIDLAKRKLFQDLNRVSTLVKQAAGTASRGVLRVVLLGALCVAALFGALLRRRRRIQFRWK